MAASRRAPYAEQGKEYPIIVCHGVVLLEAIAAISISAGKRQAK
jgi:hypothetical protein